MDIAKFYENIVLRDLLQYTAPGLISLLGGGLIAEALTEKYLRMSLLKYAPNFGVVGVGMTLFLSYVIGQVINASSKFLRKEEKKLMSKLAQGSWLADEFQKAVAHDLGLGAITGLTPPVAGSTRQTIDKPAIEKKLLRLPLSRLRVEVGLYCAKQVKDKESNNEERAETVREIGRSLLYLRQPKLYGEYIGRHSILSRFVCNLALAIIFLLFSTALSLIIVHEKFSAHIQVGYVRAWLVVIIYFGLGIVSIYFLRRNYLELRRTMMKHTMLIWYVDFIESSKKPKGLAMIDDKPMD